MYTYKQIKDALNEGRYSGEYEPDMLVTLKKLYGITEISDQEFIYRLTAPAGQYGSGREYLLYTILEPSPGADVRRYVDQYINWNGVASSQNDANAAREKALTALTEKAKQLEGLGVDISTIPVYAEFYSQLGATPGAGQTSAQTAKELGQTTVNLPDEPTRSISELQGASVGDYKPTSTPSGSSIGTYKPSTESSVGTFKGQDTGAFQTNVVDKNLDPNNFQYETQGSQYVYDAGHLGSKANNAAVNQLYNSYFGRDATAAELANWGDKGTSTVKQLEDFLQKERTKYNYTAPVKSLAGETITPTPTQTNTPAQTSVVSNIPFKAGLNDAQKQSIIDLTSKPVASWSQTDKDNWNYATNNTAIPGLTTATPTATSPTNSSIPFKSGLSDAQKASISALTNKPSSEWTQTDKDNWNYATNNAPIPGGTGSGTAPSSDIPFKDGLNDSQKQGIIDLLKNKPVDQWTQTDKDNWNYATGNAPVPSNQGTGTAANGAGQQTGVGVYQQNQANAAAEAAKNGGTGSPAAGAGATSEISAEDKKWINDLYLKYFDRTATSAELANWSKSTPDALGQFLVSEQKKYGYVSNAQKGIQSDKLKAALAIIDASNLPDEIKALWRQTVSLYPDATDFQPQQIIDTFNKIKTDTVDPYFKELTDLAVGDVKTAFSQMKDARTAELESERYNAGDAIRQAQSGLEKSGMTFSGKGIESLGAGSAYAQSGTDGATPNQVGFAGMPGIFYEGNVNQANRLLSTSTAARYATQQQTLGRAAENQLGSGAVAMNIPGLQYTPGNVNVTGALEQQKQGKYASTLQGIIENWKTSQNLKTNI